MYIYIYIYILYNIYIYNIYIYIYYIYIIYIYIYTLHIVAIGCPDIVAPPGGWIKRGDQVAVLGCSDTSETWQLHCRRVAWVGDRRNCTRGRRA